MKPVEPAVLSVVGLSLDLYRQSFEHYPERLRAQLTRFTAALSSFAEVRDCDLCFVKEDVEESIRNAERAGVDCLVLIPLSYTASMTALAPVVRTSLSIIIWNTQEAVGFDESFDVDDLLMNHTVQGVQDVTNVLTRNRRRFGMESGHFEDQKCLRRMEEWLRAARANCSAKNIRVGLLGSPFSGMGDFAVDEAKMAAEWGPEIVRLSMRRLADLYENVSIDAVADICRQDRDRFECAPDVPDSLLQVSARLELALREIVDENELDSFTMNFSELTEDGRVPTLPFYGLNKLIGEGLGCAGEGDVLTAAHMAQMRQLCGVANFTEIYTVDYRRNRAVMTHMQECNPAMARQDRKIRLVRKKMWITGCEDYPGMHFTLEPGPVTLAAFTADADGCFKYVTFRGRIVDMKPFANFLQPHWVLETEMPIDSLLAEYSMAGGPHHPGCGSE